MDEQHILDAEFEKQKNIQFRQILEWWERYRLIYNVLLVVVEVLIIVIYWKGMHNYGFDFALAHMILFNFSANAFYCFGWGFEMFLGYYYEWFAKNDGIRTLLLVSGVLISLLLAWSIFTEILYVYQKY